MPDTPLPTTLKLSTATELNELADKGQLTEESLQEKLHAYHQAYEQEFREAIEAEPNRVTEQTQDFFKNETPNAAAQIVWLAHNSTSDSVRLNCLKFIVQQGLADAKKDGDPIKTLLAELTAPT